MAKRTDFELGGTCVPVGMRKTLHLPVSVMADYTPVALSAHVIHGKKGGPTFFVSAGVQGDEVIGVEIVRRLLGFEGLNSLRGTLIVVPIVNTYGFLMLSRYLPDRRDLNRSFPGSAGGHLRCVWRIFFLRMLWRGVFTGSICIPLPFIARSCPKCACPRAERGGWSWPMCLERL